VHGPAGEAGYEHRREQVEEPAQVALQPVPRAAVLARPVVDRHLGDPVAAMMGEHGDEPV